MQDSSLAEDRQLERKPSEVRRRCKARRNGVCESGGYKLTDLGNAERFRDKHGDDFRYCATWKKWLAWDRRRWRLDAEQSAKQRVAGVARKLWDEVREHTDYAAQLEFLQFCRASESAGKINAALSLAESMLPLTHDELDRDPWLLNCPNGTLDLRTGELREHRRDDFLTKLCPTPYNPDAQSYHWDRFIESIFDGNQEVINFVQRFVGYCLTGCVREDLLVILWGDGSNGKSTFLETLHAVLGSDYSMFASPDLIMRRKSDEHPTLLADLYGMRCVMVVETEDQAELNESLVKRLTGRDRLRARRMREDYWEFEPTHKLVIATNPKPRIRGTDHAIWRRMAMVPFARRYWDADKGETGPPELKCDKGLPARLLAEREGVLAWALQGCLDWQANGIQLPKAVLAATNEYREGEDIILQFTRECCYVAPHARARATPLYQRFKAWCADHGERRVPSQRKFGEQLRLLNGVTARTSNGVLYEGIGLLDESAASA